MSKKSKSVIVLKKSITGRNQQFQDKKTGTIMSRAKFVSAIKKGKYLDFHIRNINGVKTPIPNPRKKTGNNINDTNDYRERTYLSSIEVAKYLGITVQIL